MKKFGYFSSNNNPPPPVFVPSVSLCMLLMLNKAKCEALNCPRHWEWMAEDEKNKQIIMLLVQMRTDLNEGFWERQKERRTGKEVVRAESGYPGWRRGEQEAVGEEEDRKQREEEKLLFILLHLVLLCRHQQYHTGRSGVGREVGEVELTSSSSWRSVRAFYQILHVKAFKQPCLCNQRTSHLFKTTAARRKRLIWEMLSVPI